MKIRRAKTKRRIRDGRCRCCGDKGIIANIKKMKRIKPFQSAQGAVNCYGILLKLLIEKRSIKW